MSKYPLGKVKRLATLECRVFEEQEKYIREKFGDDAADNANYGWGVDVFDKGVSVSTKIYRHGVLTSKANIGDSGIQHEFEDFETHERGIKELNPGLDNLEGQNG